MNIGQSISYCFSNYFNFSGRGSRSEFWWFYLFVIICWIIGFALGPIIEAIIILGLLIPYIAVQARRLHDIGKSGWLQLISLIPLIGAIILIVWSATEGTKKKNKYGAPIKLKKS